MNQPLPLGTHLQPLDGIFYHTCRCHVLAHQLCKLAGASNCDDDDNQEEESNNNDNDREYDDEFTFGND